MLQLQTVSHHLDVAALKKIAKYSHRQIKQWRFGLKYQRCYVQAALSILESCLFDADWYAQQNPDVAAAGIDLLKHYLQHGALEGRDPHPLFDSDWYLQCNPDVAMARMNPLAHYVQHGAFEGRDPHPLFDSDWYLQRNPDVAMLRMNPLVHYVQHGALEGRDPSLAFDTALYLKKVPEVLAKRLNPLIHYVVQGRGIHLPTSQTPELVGCGQVLAARFAQIKTLQFFSTTDERRRVVLVLDDLSHDMFKNSSQTALVFAVLLAKHIGAKLRVLTRNQAVNANGFNQVLQLQNLVWRDHVDFMCSSCEGEDIQIDLNPEDIFVTTSWYATASMRQSVHAKRIVYLLQQDERLQYPAGDDLLRCEETLCSQDISYVVQSQSLYRHFCTTGVQTIKERGLWFDPIVPPGLWRETKPRQRVKKRKRRFLFAAIPNSPMNLYYRGLEVINAAIEQQLLTDDAWEFEFFGNGIQDVLLANNIRPHRKENLSHREVTDLLRQTDMALILHYAPQPSDLARALAASGAVVVSNCLAAQDKSATTEQNILRVSAHTMSLLNALQEGIDLLEQPTPDRAVVQKQDWQAILQPVFVAMTRGSQSHVDS